VLCISLCDVTSFLVASYSKCKYCLNQVLQFSKIILIKDIGTDGWMDGWMDGLISQIYFWNRAVHVSDRFSVRHQESSTLYIAIEQYVYVIQVLLTAC